jgi:hypothetical protein
MEAQQQLHPRQTLPTFLSAWFSYLDSRRWWVPLSPVDSVCSVSGPAVSPEQPVDGQNKKVKPRGTTPKNLRAALSSA